MRVMSPLQLIPMKMTYRQCIGRSIPFLCKSEPDIASQVINDDLGSITNVNIVEYSVC